MPTAQFRLSLKKWNHLTKENLAALARQAIQELAYVVVDGTPVDIGFLRGSWQPSINQMITDADGAVDPQGSAVGAKIAATVIDIKLGDTFYMSNNAKYAMRIEYGFVGEDSLGRKYNQKGRYMVTGAVAQWDSIVAGQAAALGFGGPGGAPPTAPAPAPKTPPPSPKYRKTQYGPRLIK